MVQDKMDKNTSSSRNPKEPCIQDIKLVQGANPDGKMFMTYLNISSS